MKETKIKSIGDIIYDLLLNHFSGGAKITELVVEIISQEAKTVNENASWFEMTNPAWLNEVYDAIKNDSRLSSLEYHWPMGDIKRAKTFVYLT